MKVEIEGGEKYEKVLEKLAKFNGKVKAGIPEWATTTDGKKIAEYAIYNELGTSRMPARPFMRQTVDTHKDEWVDLLASKLTAENITKGDAETALGLVGEVMKAHIQETIQKGSFAPDSPRTVAYKRNKGKREPDHPLIDTGQMLASIISEVEI